MVELLTKLTLYIVRALAQALGQPEEQAAKALVYAAFDTGVPASILSGYLTERGADYAEKAADLAEQAKLAVQASEAEMAKAFDSPSLADSLKDKP